MNRDEINRIILDNGLFHGTMALGVVMDADHLEQFANLVAATERERIKWDTIHSCHPECDKPVCVAIRKAVAEEREKVAHWMMTACYATGHGDTTEDLLRELAWQADERIAKAVAAEREACAKVCESLNEDWDHLYVESCAFAIRERGAP